MAFSIENPIESASKYLIEIIKEFSEFVGYKINIQKSNQLYISNEKSEREIITIHLQ